MEFEFSGEIWFWRGPAPWFFVTVPEAESQQIKEISGSVTYGWGVIPVLVSAGSSTWKTSLFPKENLYLVPIKADIRKKEGFEEGDTITIRLEVAL